jgi:hypothetical protein
MKSVKGFLRAIDVFAVPLTFRYKEKVYYSTALGGLFIILLIIAALTVGIYYFIPFMNRKNFTIVYYTMNLSQTEQIKLHESKANFAFGLNCEKEVNGLNVFDVLKLETKFIIFTKKSDGTFDKKKQVQSTHSCGNADFYNNYNDSVDYLNLAQYQCLDDTEHIIEGIYSDQVFSYYEFSATALDGTEENFKNIDTFLLNNDCKLQLYYTDITFDLVNYEEPIKDYLNSLFIQIDPTLFVKRNIFFMNQYLYDDDYLIWNFGDDDAPTQRTLFSRYEEYALYQGMNRHILKPPDYLNYARIYIRADTRRTDIKRKYQKLMEFYADISSMVITVYRILIIFFNFVNTFYAMHSVAKRIFFFKEIEQKHFNVFKQVNGINELIDLTDSYIYGDIENEYMEKDPNYATKNKNLESEKKPEEDKNININVYKNNKQNLMKKNAPPPHNTYGRGKRDYERREKYQEKESESSAQSKILKNRRDITSRNNSTYRRGDKRNKNMDINMNIRIQSRNNGFIYNIKPKEKDKDIESMNGSDRTRMEEIRKKKLRNRKINYKFNIFEVICASFFNCCLPQNLARKNNINEKANSIIFNKLDLVSYVRNMILLDIIYDSMLEGKKKDVINFLSRPVISLNINDKFRPTQFYRRFRSSDFARFSDSLNDMVQTSKGEMVDKKLIDYINRQLKDII